MKKYRCPYCGEESITSANKLLCNNIGRRRHLYKIGNACPACGQYYAVRFRGSRWIDALFLLLIVGVPLLFLILGFWNPLYCALSVLTASVGNAFLLIPLQNRLFGVITQYDQEDFYHVRLDPNAEITLTDTTNAIKDQDIYGIRFDKRADLPRFREVFKNDLVPVVFFREKGDRSRTMRVTVMKSQYVPDTLLCEGAAFTVVDNGREIATGVFKTVYQNQSGV